MDPDACLNEIRVLAKVIDYPNVDDEDCLRFLELVIALDEWLTKGGFPPRQWTDGGVE